MWTPWVPEEMPPEVRETPPIGSYERRAKERGLDAWAKPWQDCWCGSKDHQRAGHFTASEVVRQEAIRAEFLAVEKVKADAFAANPDVRELLAYNAGVV